MGERAWSLFSLAAFKERDPESISVLWASQLPASRDVNPALWDTLIGFFQEAVIDICRRQGHLVSTPRELLRQLKHAEREPACGPAVVDELFRRGDIVRAGNLRDSSESPTGTFKSLRAVIGTYFWSSRPKEVPSLDDPIVPVASLEEAANKALTLVGPVATSEIHTVSGFAAELTGGNIRDAEAIISYLISQGKASLLHTMATKDNPVPVAGVKLGKGMPTQPDKGVLQTRAALERMQNLSKHLEEAVGKEKEAATNAARKGNKREALSRLRKKAVIEKKLASSSAAASKLADVLMAVDEAESNKEAVNALETGMESLKIATKGGATAEQVDTFAADLDQMLGAQEDVRVALQQLNDGSLEENAQLEEELESLMQEEDYKSLNDPSLVPPVTKPQAPVPVAEKPIDEFEAALEQLMADVAAGGTSKETPTVTDTTEELSRSELVGEKSSAARRAGRISAPEL